MKIFFAFLLVCLAISSSTAQKTDDVLATATGHTFRLRDLSPETQKDVADLPASIPKARISLLEQLISRRVFDAEARSRGITTGKLLADEKAKTPDPKEPEIKVLLDANQDRLAGLTPQQARRQAVSFLRNGPEQKALAGLFTLLKAKYKVMPGKDVNDPKLAATDTVAIVNGQAITGKEFNGFADIPLYEARADLAAVILDELDEHINSVLVVDEAKSLGLDPGDLIAREVTNKMKEFSDEERLGLEVAFRQRLHTKYQVKVLYGEPAPPVQNVSVDDDPSSGPASAPVTIVMFSDFQCSACSATHPILKKVIDEFPGKIRFVVRDLPLESIHENAFLAARAAGAANAQGKFFEYAEILYKHQDALDTVSLRKYAAESGLNVKQFELDFNSEKIAAEIRKDMDDGESYVIHSTPTIFINGMRVRHLSAAAFRTAIQRALGK